MRPKFVLTDSEAELLVHFEIHQRLEPLAQVLGRDLTVISKQLKRIAAKADVLAKVSGRWVLTESGRALNRLTRDYLLSQQATLNENVSLRIGTNREFGSRVVARYIEELQAALGRVTLSLKVYEAGIEAPLLSGEIDLGFDCGQPQSPEIAHSIFGAEVVLPIAAPAFFDRLKSNDLAKLPHIFFPRQNPARVMGDAFAHLTLACSTNDVAVARELCVQGVGWALLPRYAIAEELGRGLVVPAVRKSYCVDNYGVWHVRSRPTIKAFAEKTLSWFQSIRRKTSL